MHLAYHGGKCCGIKTIYGFQSNPEHHVAPIEDYIRIRYCNLDSNGDDVTSEGRFFHATAPKETGIERLDRYLRYCDQRRPGGVIEIVLADFDWMPSFNAAWWPILEERGFTKTATFQNSNSGNKVTVYHRVRSADDDDQPDADDFAYEWDQNEGVSDKAREAAPKSGICSCGDPLCEVDL